ncbi:UDP-N-acetylmuramate dehydrogenase [Massilia antarctica]|uniref:UDP-N-acetylenolpyruvoylglucosamine reductase n=1 Tax=Massilia antarctica TaxID=2765360 RepID=A0AA48W9K4_9BURK|nr:UDP-N-acetylmuramate dehydrogenase [Massilia antarctica]QPI47392.1 UDP-N-acetylmuramate dehydrogenase [Massilia antarctica]
MQPDLVISPDFSLRAANTFGIDARARAYLKLTRVEQLAQVMADPVLAALPRLLLGGGSNIVLTGDFDGLVLHMAIAGREVLGEEGGSMLVRAGAGENWHGFVQWTLAQGLGGLENMALIPGTVGASPIQNIGAYGAEVKDLLHALTVFELSSGRLRVMDAAACRFGYRDSVFKHADGAGLVIVDVTFALPRAWAPNLTYAELAQEVAAARLASPTAQQVSDAVVAIRRRKLPDPAQIGNAGSFFKNPVVSAAQCAAMLAAHPALVHHAQGDGSEKLAAGWLIDQCGWKGRSLGAAGVYDKQALVLVNRGGATGGEVLALARAIQADVLARFGVALETEPVFV